MHDAHYRLLCIPFSQMAYIPLPSNSAYKHPQELHGHGMRRATEGSPGPRISAR